MCLSGALEDKLEAAATAGFDGVEIFEPDLVTSAASPAAVARLAAELGLSLDLYQPFRDFEAAPGSVFQDNLRRAERKLDVMEQLGTETILVCSSVSPDAVDDDELAAGQLTELAEHAARRGMRVAYEALAWGRHVSTWQHSWEIVQRSGHPALGLCLDSFHILSRAADATGIANLPGDKVFFVQLADAPRLAMDVLQWSRHHRLFPGQGAFDLVGFVDAVLATGYAGPLSLEVFNDVFRQADPARTAVDAMRSLLVLEEGLRRGPAVPPAPDLLGYAFTELAVDGVSGPEVGAALAALGFAHTGQHRSKPVELWEQGTARVLLNAAVVRAEEAPGQAAIRALAVESADPEGSAARAVALLAPLVPRRRGPAEADLTAVLAPDDSELFFCRPDGRGWRDDFLDTDVPTDRGAGLLHIDHVALAQPFDHFDEAGLFYGSALGLEEDVRGEFAAPFGLVRTLALRDPGRRVRLALSVSLLRRGEWAPGVPDPQHIAFGTDDIDAAAQRLRASGAPLVPVPQNYYDDLDARLGLGADLLDRLQRAGLLYDRDQAGEFLHLYTEVLGGRVFFEVVAAHRGLPGIRRRQHTRTDGRAPAPAATGNDAAMSDESDEAPSRYYVRAVERALRVIRAFDARQRSMSLSDVARATELDRATVRRLLLTLVDLGYVREEGREFVLTPRVLALGYAYLSGVSLVDIAQPHLQHMAHVLDETAALTVLDDDHVVYVSLAPSTRLTAVTITVGTRFEAYATSMGRVLLAGLSDDELDAHLAEVDIRPRTARTITSVDELRAEILRAREQGWALVDQELEDGLCGVSVPVRDRFGAPVAAVNVSAHSSRTRPADLAQTYLPHMLKAVAAIEADLGATQH